MGNYLNPDISTFARVVNSEIYVDKTGLIEYTNRSAKTLQSYICISRPRRFGKSIAANMLSAYYTCEYDSRELFSNLKIASSDSYEKHLNKYDVIFLNMQEFLSYKQVRHILCLSTNLLENPNTFPALFYLLYTL